MKRVLGIIAAIALLLPGMTTGIMVKAEPIPKPADYNRELVHEKFDELTALPTPVNTSAWDRKAAGGLTYNVKSAAELGLPDAENHGKVLELAKDTTNVDNYLRINYQNNRVVLSQCDASELKRVQASFDLYFTEKSQLNIRFYDNTSGSTKGDNLLIFQSGGTIQFLNGGTMPYETEKWYSFDVYLDFTEGGSYSVYCNGVLAAENLSTTNLDTCIVSFGVQMSETTSAYTYYLDNMRFAIPDTFRLVESTPTDGTENVSVTTDTAKLIFSYPIANFDVSMITVTAGGETVQNVTATENNGAITLTFPQELAYGTTYTITVDAGLTDVYGNALTTAQTISFTTESKEEPITGPLNYNRELVDESFNELTALPTSVWDRKAAAGLTYNIKSAAELGLPDAENHGKVLELAKDTTNVDNYLRINYQNNRVVLSQCDASELKRVQASFDLYFTEKSQLNIRFYDNTSGSTKGDNLLIFQSGGTIQFLNGGTMPYETEKWYSFDVYLDFTEGGSYSVYCNGVLAAENLSTTNLDTCIVSFGVQMSETTSAYTYYLDNMRFAIPDTFRLVESTPTDGTENVNVMDAVTITLSNPVNNFNTSMVVVKAGGENAEDVTITEKNGVITATFPQGLAYNTAYTVELDAGLTDIYGQQLTATNPISFTTMREGFAASLPVFRNSEGTTVEEWSADDTITAAAAVKNPELSEKTVVLVTAVYDENGSMVKLFTNEKSVPAGQVVDLETKIDIPYAEGYTVRSFLSENQENYKPVSERYAVLPEGSISFHETAPAATVTLKTPTLNQNNLAITGEVSRTEMMTLVIAMKNAEGETIMVTPVQTDSAGAFIYDFMLPEGVEGLLTVTVCGVNTANCAEKDVAYLNDTQKEEITAQINAATSAAGVGSVMEAYREVLNMDDTFFQSSTYQVVYEQAPYQSYEAFWNTAALAVDLLQQINAAEWSGLTTLLGQYGDVILGGVNGTSKYMSSSTNDKNAINKTLVMSSPFAGIVQFRETFTRVVEAYQPNQGGTGSGGGGGSSSGGGGSASNSSGNGYYVASEIGTGTTGGTEPSGDTGFIDLETVPWAQKSILALCEAGVVSKAKEFRPLDSITREEFTKLLVELLDLPLEETACSFTDAAPSAWYYSYLAAAQKAGMIQGYPEGNFGIGELITRQDMAVMARRAIDAVGKSLPEVRQPNSFSDADTIDGYALSAVEDMQRAGVVSGVGNNLFAPNDFASRAEAAVMINNLLRIVNEEVVK